MRELENCVLRVLERHDGKCLDNEAERKAVARALCRALRGRFDTESSAYAELHPLRASRARP